MVVVLIIVIGWTFQTDMAGFCRAAPYLWLAVSLVPAILLLFGDGGAVCFWVACVAVPVCVNSSLAETNFVAGF